ncbi:PASTA domain-containing protein [Mycolicibacterium boenickei]
MPFGATACTFAQAPSDEIVVPDLVGLYWKDAFKRLRSSGWMGSIDKGPDVDVEPKDRGRIVSQIPAAGQHSSRDAVITLQFGKL